MPIWRSRADGGWFTLFDPDCSPLDHPALWDPDEAPCVLRLDQAASKPAKCASRILAEFVTDDVVHRIIADERGRHRLSLKSSRQHTALVLPLDDLVDIRLALAVRYARYLRTGHGGDPTPIWPAAAQRRRLTTLLRVADARANGATARAIARHVIGATDTEVAAIVWKSTASRRRVYRLISEARSSVAGSYRLLLAGTMPG